VNDYVLNDTLSPSLSADMSASLWMNTTELGAPGNNFRMFDLSQGASRGLQIMIQASTGNVGLDNLGGPGVEMFSASSKADGNWHHVVVTRASATYTFFVDSILEFGITGTAPTYTRSYLGADSGLNTADNFSGFLDDVRIYNQALTQNEIAAIYDEGANP
jgi:hypothetical protein